MFFPCSEKMGKIHHPQGISESVEMSRYQMSISVGGLISAWSRFNRRKKL